MIPTLAALGRSPALADRVVDALSFLAPPTT
jgi:hypothetical protein